MTTSKARQHAYRKARRARRNHVSTALPRWWTELTLLLTVYIAYDLTRGLQHASVATADHNGQQLMRWEGALHLAPERPLSTGLDHLPVLAVLAAYFYATLHFMVTPAVLIWLYRTRPVLYRRCRTWLVTATIPALMGFWLFPVTPPRLLPQSHIPDIVADVHRWGWWSGHSSAPRGMGSLANEYAAMPSLHLGWALWSGWLLYGHARRRWVRALGATYPVVTALVVIATGNHYLVDCVAGAALVVVAGMLTTAGYQYALRWTDLCATPLSAFHAAPTLVGRANPTVPPRRAKSTRRPTRQGAGLQA